MKIAFDVDNVLADTMTHWCRKASKHLGRTVVKDDIRSHKVVGSVPMSPYEIFKLQDEVWTEWSTLAATEKGLAKKLGVFRSNGFRVLIVTSRPFRSVDSVKNWLALQEICYDEFQAIGPYESKSKIEADALVDDAPDHIRDFARNRRTGFLYAQPWNRNASVNKAVIVENIGEVLNFYKLKE